MRHARKIYRRARGHASDHKALTCGLQMQLLAKHYRTRDGNNLHRHARISHFSLTTCRLRSLPHSHKKQGLAPHETRPCYMTADLPISVAHCTQLAIRTNTRHGHHRGERALNRSSTPPASTTPPRDRPPWRNSALALARAHSVGTKLGLEPLSSMAYSPAL